MTKASTTQDLAAFVSELRFEDLPQKVVERTGELFLDWLGSALAGVGERPVRIVDRVSERMGPGDGPCEIFGSRRRSSPLFAALVNGASSHVVEQDDLHNGSVLHPATVVFPAALAAAQQMGVTGREFLVAVVAGYETGIRVGEFLGRSHYEVFHTTGTAGTLAAAAAVSRVLGADQATTLNSLGSAGTQAAGLWEFLRDAADSKQLHSAKAASDGLLSAYLAQEGFTGASRILEGDQGMAAGMSTSADPERLTDRLGERWALLETSFKVHACCRHAHPAGDALLRAMSENDLTAEEVRSVRARVHGPALDVLGPVTEPKTVHQSKFSMGFILGLLAVRGRAGIEDFDEEALKDPEIWKFHDRVEMVLDTEVDAAYPERWVGLVEVETAYGEHLVSRIEAPRGDPGNPLSREELECKARRLASFGGSVSPEEMDEVTVRALNVHEQPNVKDFLSGL